MSPTLRIVCVGTSITEGVTGAYRPELGRLLAARGVAFAFVGRRVDGAGFHHEGVVGRTATEIAADLPDALAASDPDLVLLEAGANAEDPDAFDAAIRRCVKICQKWRAQLLIATVLVQPEHQLSIDLENEKLVALARERPARVSFVPMSAVTADMLRDDVHPAREGYVVMARAWDAAIGRALGSRLWRALVGLAPIAAALGWFFWRRRRARTAA